MRGIRLIAPVALVFILTGALVADDARQGRGESWVRERLAAIVSGRNIDDSLQRYERADRSDQTERRKWDQLADEAAETNQETPPAAKPAGLSGPILDPPAGSDDAAMPQGNRANSNSVASRSIKKPFGAVPGNPTGKRVKRKTPIDDGAAPTLIIQRPY